LTHASHRNQNDEAAKRNAPSDQNKKNKKEKNRKEQKMNLAEFKSSLAQSDPPATLSIPLAALWWDAKGDWTRAHDLVDELESQEGMAVHAYLHRKGGQSDNADYWYARAGRQHHRPDLTAEWQSLTEALLPTAAKK
jgi:hypothetical protein